MNIKERILKEIFNNPNRINSFLLKLNLWPEKVYGKRYLANKNGKINFNIEDRLLKIVNTAIKEVPYYKQRYKEVKNLKEFTSTIGFIDKSVVSENFELFKAQSIDQSKYIFGTTGGTSGKPLKFLIPKNRYEIELSTMHNMWNRTGWQYHLRGVLRNHHIPEGDVYKINPITKEYIFDNFRLNPKYAFEIYRILKRHNIQFIHAYPSAAYQFCKLCKEQNLDLSFINSFLCGSEGVLEFQRKLICNELGLKIYSWYGHSEKLVLGGYCEYSNDIHIEPYYGYFELIDENNSPITEVGKVGEIVGTTLYNFGMPLIRYRTGDYAEYVGNKCKYCGREMTIIKNIRGRWDKNRIFKNDGTYITTTALNLHSELYAYIEGLQYIQDCPGALTILLIKSNLFKQEHEKLFADHYKKSFGSDNSVKIEYVDQLIMQPNGKFELLISRCLKESENKI
ncbi:MAG: phenylacetate--CoA ligase family protein [Bacteroidota bacterium]|nr:phenylacetate--CoA ligase family protein [Bacteroidota bacterium]